MKKILFAIGFMIVVVSLAMAGGQQEAGGEAKDIVLVYNQLEPPEHPQGVTQAKFAEKLAELSGGQITVEVHASGNSFHTGRRGFSNDGRRSWTCRTSCIPGYGAPYLPAANMFAAPYIFTSYDHMERVFDPDSAVASEFYDMVADACGYTPLAAMTQGSRTINTKWEKPIMTPADMEGMILRMPNAPAWIDAGTSLGGNVTPIAYSEVYTALQTGTIEAPGQPASRHLRNEILRSYKADITHKAYNRRKASMHK